MVYVLTKIKSLAKPFQGNVKITKIGDRKQRWWIQNLHKCASGEEFSYFLQPETGSRK